MGGRRGEQLTRTAINREIAGKRGQNSHKAGHSHLPEALCPQEESQAVPQEQTLQLREHDKLQLL